LDLCKDELQKTIMLDPEHKFARDELGYIRDKDNRWILPQEKSEEPAGTAAPAATEAPKPVEQAPEVKFDANGFSPELATALGALNTKDAKATLEKLDATIDEEGNRLLKVLTGPFSKNRDKVAQTIGKTVTGAEVSFGKVGTEGTKDEAITTEIRAHVDAYVEKTVKPAVLAAVKHAEAQAEGDLVRNVAFLKTFVKDYHTDSATKRREKAWSDWDKARDVAIRTIFDLKIYPDENHGRVGQKIVDEKVDAVRAAWQFLDPQVQRDLSRFLATSEADAKRTIQLLQDARTREKACLAWLEAKGDKREATSEPATIEEALLTYRAGEFQAAFTLASKLSGYEKELVKRIRDQRVLDYNNAFKTAKVTKGKQPNGQEIEQVAITNDYRIMMGRPAIEIDTRLVEAARGHSEEMTRLGYFEHMSPVAANKTPWDRMKNAGYEGAGGENISLGSEAPKATHIAWYNSSGHHRNILGAEWNAMGAGKDGRHWTQDFGGAAGQLAR
ncbi:MAG TPA: CAP domain-containing protein, partial [Planctomycetota bacterium]|nr:CAP domain-containing protein [Planctomycetota bacterium]